MLIRRRIHANKLFYCDVCSSGEKGARGFEEFADVVKHVVKENGLDIGDVKKVNDLIRIPRSPDHLKVFKCLFCPGAEGMKFVGLSEETFLEHISNKHGQKAPRARPHNLVRECRVCAKTFITDVELADHIVRKHINGSTAPFAGFGPRNLSDDSDSSSDEDDQPSKSGIRHPPASKSLASVSPSRRSARDNEAVMFLDRVARAAPSAYRRQNENDSVAPQLKRRRLEEQCRLCSKSCPDLMKHMSLEHKEQSFSCTKRGCEHLAWVTLSEVTDHILNTRHHARTSDPNLLIAEGHMRPPRILECIQCQFCDPHSIIVGEDWGDLKNKHFEHLEQHLHLHQEDQRKIDRRTGYMCRMCDEAWSTRDDLQRHMREEHKPGSSKRSLTPRGVDKRRRQSDREEGEVRSPPPAPRSPSSRRRSGGASGGHESREQKSFYSSMPPPRAPAVDDKFVCLMCESEFDEVGHLHKHLIRQHRVPDTPSTLATNSNYPAELRYVHIHCHNPSQSPEFNISVLIDILIWILTKSNST